MSSSDLPHGGMFINYRRSDSQYAAGRLADSLVREFGDIRVFRDLRDIPAGHDFSEVLEQSLSECNTMLVLIGENWLTARDDSGHFRITNEHDWVRREIESALGRNIRVIPVLIDLARLPPAHSLPATLAPLARRQAVRLTDEHWDRDVEALIQSLRKDLKLPEQHASTLAAAHILRRAGTTLAIWLRRFILTAVTLLLLLIGLIFSTCSLDAPELAGNWVNSDGWQLAFQRGDSSQSKTDRRYRVTGQYTGPREVNCEAEQNYSLVKMACRVASAGQTVNAFHCEQLSLHDKPPRLEGDCVWIMDNSTRWLSLMRK